MRILILIMLLIPSIIFAQETYDKLDEYTIQVTKPEVKNSTLDDITAKIDALEQAKIDVQGQADAAIARYQTEIDKLNKWQEEAGKLGIKTKPVELEPIESPIEEIK